MKLKKGVKVQGVRPEIVLALIAADRVYRENGAVMVVTSVVDGAHSATSLHYTGAGADLRRWNLPNPRKAADAISEALGDDYDVILEDDHIHIEYQPKR